MKKFLFQGVCTALVTPFLNGSINYPLLERLIRRQIDAGIEAIVLSGTTGESPTLSDTEKLELFKKARQYASGQCLIIAGTGSNNTEHALALSRAAEKIGVDGLLLVSPYYNKATQDGLVTHYSTIASGVHIPIILYNVPSRTGMDIPVKVYQTLSHLPNIAGIKEASADISKIARIKSACPDLQIWSGNDDQITATMALGCDGVISVVSNLLPEQTQAMAKAALAGDFDTAADLQLKLLPLIEVLFREVNPIPVKAAMALLGYDCGHCRLPLTSASSETIKLLKNLLLPN